MAPAAATSEFYFFCDCPSTADHPTQIFASHGKYLAHKVFHFARRTKASSYVQVFVAFFLSGLVHTRARTDARALHFFLLQAAGVLFEDVVFSCIKRAGLEHRLRAFWWLGYAWVWCWFLYSFPPYWDCMLHTGMFDVGRDLSFLIAPSRLDGLFRLIKVSFFPFYLATFLF